MIHLHPKEIALLERLQREGKLAHWPFTWTPEKLLERVKWERHEAACFLRSYRKLPRQQRAGVRKMKADSLLYIFRRIRRNLRRLQWELSTVDGVQRTIAHFAKQGNSGTGAESLAPKASEPSRIEPPSAPGFGRESHPPGAVANTAKAARFLMQTAWEFIEAYLREQAAYIKSHHQHQRAFGENFYSDECPGYPWIGHRFAPFERLSMIKYIGDTAALAFTMNLETRKKWRRYHLRLNFGKWEIHNWDSFCRKCNGAGRYGMQMQFCDGKWTVQNQGEKCPICGGSGWWNESVFLNPAAWRLNLRWKPKATGRVETGSVRVRFPAVKGSNHSSVRFPSRRYE